MTHFPLWKWRGILVMHWIDLTIIIGYLLIVLAIGVYFLFRQKSLDEYYVGNRSMGAGHLGFSVVATDVGGGFSIGLGGLGYLIGLSGSWMLFTGLIGAWLAAVLLIPKVKHIGDKLGFLTYPDFLEHRFDSRTRLVAAIVSGLGYAGFVGGQVLAGAKLGTAVFDISLPLMILIMAGVAVLYTSFGGLEAVVYTDSIQWAVLLIGLLFFALPFAYMEIGGWAVIQEAVPPAKLSLFNISWTTFFTWLFTIVPIWFVGMTLYQRIYAARDVKTAKRAWYLAGLLEWPLMAFAGVILGMFSSIMYPFADEEMGLPLLIKNVLPIGLVGLVSAAYFSAIMSTADSCLLASSGNLVNDLYQRYLAPKAGERQVLWVGRIVTFAIGIISVLIAFAVPDVLAVIMLTYGFMVSGLFVPTLAGLYWNRCSSTAALLSMLAGGGLVVVLNLIPDFAKNYVDPILISLPVSAIVIVIATFIWPNPIGADADIVDVLKESENG